MTSEKRTMRKQAHPKQVLFLSVTPCASPHGVNDSVISSKRFVNVALANQNCYGENSTRYGDNCNCCRTL